MIGRYEHKDMVEVWSDENKYLRWMQISLTFLNQYVNYKKIRRASDLKTPARFESQWVREIEEIERVRQHDVAAFVEWLETYVARLEPDVARYVHFGLTSADINDTTFTMQIRDSNGILQRLIWEVNQTLGILANQVGDTQILGRTHGRAAEPLPFKQKLQSYISALTFLKPRAVYYGKLCGSVGNTSHFPKEVARAALSLLGLEPCPIVDGQVIQRGYYAEFMHQWAVLASSIAKIATDIRLLAQTGIDELAEPFSKGQIGSSSMPHKRNPVKCENVCGAARLIRGYQTAVMQDIELWNERDISHSIVERVAFSDASILLAFSLDRMNKILGGLVINKEQIARNLATNQEDIVSQKKMLERIEQGESRTAAHEEERKS